MKYPLHHILLLAITWVLTIILTPLPVHGFMNTIPVCNRRHSHHHCRRLLQGQDSGIKPVFGKKGIGLLLTSTQITARTSKRQTLSEKFQLQLSNDNNNEENNNGGNTDEDEDNSKELIDPLLILPLATSGGILGLILFVLYTKFTNPATDFDIDFYMALDDMTTNTASGNGGGGGGYYGNPDGVMAADTILGLPKLSPAEQLVGALFGPPSIP